MPNKKIANGTVHKTPRDLELALRSNIEGHKEREGLTPLARNEWIYCILRKDKEISPSVKKIIAEQS